MKLGDDELKQIYQARTVRGVTADCPTAEILINAALGTVNAEEKARLADHLVTCSSCAEEYRLVLSNTDASATVQTVQESSAGRRSAIKNWIDFRGFSMRHWRVATAFALIAIATTTTFIFWQASRRSGDSDKTTRGGAGTVIQIVPRDRSVLTEAPRELAWSAVEHADSYRVVIYDYRSTPLWESAPVAGTSVALPESVQQQLRGQGKVIYWRIIIQRGIESRSSDLFQFTIRSQ
jgi:hypothetical protein